MRPLFQSLFSNPVLFSNPPFSAPAPGDIMTGMPQLCSALPSHRSRPYARPWRMSRIIALTVLSWALAASAAAGGESGAKHVMSFDRRPAVGQSYKFTCSYKRTQTATFAGPEKREPSKRRYVSQCEGIWTPLAVGDDGRTTKISFTVERFTHQLNDGPEQSIPRGTIVTSELKDGKTVFAMHGGEVPKDVRLVLGEFMFLGSASVSADERFGTKVPRAAGEEWPISAAATAAAFGAVGSKVDEKDIAGTVKLSGLREVDSVQCFVIESDYRAANVTPMVPQADRPDAVSEFHERATVMLPVEESRIRARFSTANEYTTRYTLKPKDGPATPVVETDRVEFDQHSVPIERGKERDGENGPSLKTGKTGHH